MREIKFYETYYFCNTITNILNDQFEYLGALDSFYGHDNIYYLVDPFKKYSSFHHFIEFVVNDIYHEEAITIDLNDRKRILKQFKNDPSAIQEMKPNKLPIENAFDFYSIEYSNFESYLKNKGKNFLSCDEDDIFYFISDLNFSDEYEKLIQQTVNEVFHVLFQNRYLMMTFNIMIANIFKIRIIHISLLKR